MPTFNESASLWVTRFAPLIRSGGTVLDLACGSGRNARWLAQQGWSVEAVDRNAGALAEMQGINRVATQQADLEADPWPYPGRTFDGIIVCRYLHRPLFPQIATSLAEGGVLIYETFMIGQEQIGRPHNPEFLLRPNELLQVYEGILQVELFEQGCIAEPTPAFIQRICALNQGGKLANVSDRKRP